MGLLYEKQITEAPVAEAEMPAIKETSAPKAPSLASTILADDEWEEVDLIDEPVEGVLDTEDDEDALL